MNKSTAILLSQFLDSSSILNCYLVCKEWSSIFSETETSNTIWMNLLIRERYVIDSTLMDSEGNGYVPDFKKLFLLLKQMNYNLHHGKTHVREHVGVTKFVRDMYAFSTGETDPRKVNIDELTGRLYCSNDTIIYCERKRRGEDSRIYLYDARRLRLRRVLEPMKDLKRVYPELDFSNCSILFSELRGALSLYYVQVAFPYDPFKVPNGLSNPPPAPILRKDDEDPVPDEFKHLGRVNETTFPSSKREPRHFKPDSLLNTFVKPGCVCNLNIPPLLPHEVPLLMDNLKIMGANVGDNYDGNLTSEGKEKLKKIRERKGTAFISTYSQMLSQALPKRHIVDLPLPNSKMFKSPFNYKGRAKSDFQQLNVIKQHLMKDFIILSPHVLGTEIQLKAAPPPDEYYFEPDLILPRGLQFEIRLNKKIIKSLIMPPDDIYKEVMEAFNHYMYPETFEEFYRARNITAASKYTKLQAVYEAIAEKRKLIDTEMKSWKKDSRRPCGLAPMIGRSHELEAISYRLGKVIREMGKGFMLLHLTSMHTMHHYSQMPEDIANRLRKEQAMMEILKRDFIAKKAEREAAGVDSGSLGAETESAVSDMDYSEVSVDLRHRFNDIDKCELHSVPDEDICPPPEQPLDNYKKDDTVYSSCHSVTFQDKTDAGVVIDGQNDIIKNDAVVDLKREDDLGWITPRSGSQHQPEEKDLSIICNADQTMDDGKKLLPPASSSSLDQNNANKIISSSPPSNVPVGDSPPPPQPETSVEEADDEDKDKQKKKKYKWHHTGYFDGHESGLPVQSHRVILFYDVTTGSLLWHSPCAASATGLAYLNEHNHVCSKCGPVGKAISIASCVAKEPVSSINFHNMWTGEQVSKVDLIPPLSKDTKNFINFNISKDDHGLSLITFPVFNKWKCQRSTIEVFDLQQIYEIAAANDMNSIYNSERKRPSTLPPFEDVLKNSGRSGIINIVDTWQVREVCLSSTRIFILTALDVHCFDVARYRGKSVGAPKKSANQKNPDDPYDIDDPLAAPTTPLWKLSDMVGKKPLKHGYLDFAHYGSGILAFTTMQGMQVSLQLAWVGEDCTCLNCLPPSSTDGFKDSLPFRTPTSSCVNKGRRPPWHKVCGDSIVELLVPEIDNCNDPEMLLGVVWLAAGGRFVVCDFCRGGYYIFSTRTLDLVYRMRQPSPSKVILDEIIDEAGMAYPDVRHIPRTVSRSLPINDMQAYKILRDGLVEVHDFARDPIDDPHLKYVPRQGLYHLDNRHNDDSRRELSCNVEDDSRRESASYPFDPLYSKHMKCLWENRTTNRPFGMPERCLVYRRRVRVVDSLVKEFRPNKDEEDNPNGGLNDEEIANLFAEDEDDDNDWVDEELDDDEEDEFETLEEEVDGNNIPLQAGFPTAPLGNAPSTNNMNDGVGSTGGGSAGGNANQLGTMASVLSALASLQQGNIEGGFGSIQQQLLAVQQQLQQLPPSEVPELIQYLQNLGGIDSSMGEEDDVDDDELFDDDDVVE